MKSWNTIIALAAACFCGGFGKTKAQETTEPETLEIQYTDSSGAIYSTPVAKDVESLSFTNLPITSLTLSEDFLLSWRTTTEPSHVITPIPASVRVFKAYEYSPRITHREDVAEIEKQLIRRVDSTSDNSPTLLRRQSPTRSSRSTCGILSG